MKLNPKISETISHFFLNQGVTRGVLYLTVGSILFSVLVTFFVSRLFGGNASLHGYSIAIIVPTILASTIGYISLSMYFELERSRQEIHALAITDELTQIFNRRHFFQLAQRELERSRRNGHPLAIVLFDIDDFKQVNDSHGHMAGDLVLKETCQACKVTVRPYDIFARFGGEEFIFLLPDTDDTRAVAVADRLRQVIAERVVFFDTGNVQMTISIGIAIFNPKKDTLDDVISRADSALYIAKKLGKNRLEVA